jgi:hypothetical protein
MEAALRLLELTLADRLRAYQAAGVVRPDALAALLARDVIDLAASPTCTRPAHGPHAPARR